ncbi:hypothetical protein [Methanobacterium sp.]
MRNNSSLPQNSKKFEGPKQNVFEAGESIDSRPQKSKIFAGFSF